MIPDAIIALRAIVLADAGVAALVGARVFGDELPDLEAPNMPRYACVLSPAGGPPDHSYVPISRQSIDVRAYGPTPLGAKKLHLAVHNVLKNLRRSVSLGTLIHSLTVESGPYALREPEAGAEWPLVFASYGLLVSEESVA